MAESTTAEEEQFQLISNEIKVLHSIFCGHEEFLFNGSPPDTGVDDSCRDLVEGKIKNLLLSFQIFCGESIKLRLSFSLTKDYPNVVPDISISSAEMTKKKIAELHERVVADARSTLTQCSEMEPRVLKLINWLQDNVPKLCSPVDNNQRALASDIVQHSKGEKIFIALLQFDHMRSRKKYLKKISNSMKEFHLNGYMLFYAKGIFAIIEGLKVDISKFLKWLRTSTVDVDSAGKPCKERMMDLLCELEKTEQHSIQSGFQIVDCGSLNEFEKIFQATGLSDEYHFHIKCSSIY